MKRKHTIQAAAAAALALSVILFSQTPVYAAGALKNEVVSRQVTAALNRRSRVRQRAANSGKILPAAGTVTVPTAGIPAETVSGTPGNLAVETGSSQLISAEEAKNIALRHSGAGSLHFTKVELSREDDYGYAYVYEIEGRNGNVEYEFDIHGETGAVLEYSVEIDD